MLLSVISAASSLTSSDLSTTTGSSALSTSSGTASLSTSASVTASGAALSSSQVSPSASGSQTNGGAIAGGVVAGLAAIALIFGAGFFLRRRKSNRNAAENHRRDLHRTMEGKDGTGRKVSPVEVDGVARHELRAKSAVLMHELDGRTGRDVSTELP